LKNLNLAFLGAVFILTASGVVLAKKDKKKGLPPQENVLNAVGSFTLNVKELSALAPHPEEPDTFFAIGDRGYQVVQFQIPTDPSKLQIYDFGKIIPGALIQKGSQWEALQVDVDQTAVVLVEDPARVLVLDLKTKTLKTSFDLSIKDNHPLAASWKRDPGSRGEGLLLLEGGLLLVAKEKKPAALLLFGPSGTPIPPEVRVLKGSAWAAPAPELKTMELLHAWSPSEKAAQDLQDISELAVDSKGQVAALSDESRQICFLKMPLSTAEMHFDTELTLAFPEKISHPEGLVIQGSRIIVGLDNMARKPNIHAFIRNQ
jgi:hypothetical protein